MNYRKDYFESERPEVFALVEPSAKIILDVGCGAGTLGASLKKQYPKRKIFGLEIDQTAAFKARKFLDQVFVGDIQNCEINIEPGTLDCIILADVLEHVVHPERVLVRLKPLLRPNGCVIVSLPNMRHYTVFIRLLINGWQYEDSGLFDKTHLRFFSRQSMIDLIENAGFRIDVEKSRFSGSIKMKAVNVLCFNKLKDFITAQYIFRARLS